ncbi:MAG: translation initiation factor [Saprospiraceae bacterium]
MAKNKNRRTVYSTNPDFDFDAENEDPIEDTPYANQKIYVSIDRKKRRGKEVTLVEGFKGSKDELKDLAKMLKSKCGVGGSAKDGEIIVQGNHRDKVIELLKKEGFGKVISKGG